MSRPCHCTSKMSTIILERRLGRVKSWWLIILTPLQPTGSRPNVCFQVCSISNRCLFFFFESTQHQLFLSCVPACTHTPHLDHSMTPTTSNSTWWPSTAQQGFSRMQITLKLGGILTVDNFLKDTQLQWPVQLFQKSTALCTLRRE
jgi:hypothetical protein